MKRYFRISAAVMVLGLMLGAIGIGTALAEYPDKMITYIVPFKAGGGTDRSARILSTAAIDRFGQPWHVRNMPGASGIVGWKDLLRRTVHVARRE